MVSLNSEDHLSCFLCLEICEDAVEFNCCHNIACEKCAKTQTTCPFCRTQGISYSVSFPLRRIISNLPSSCEDCNQPMSRSEKKSHQSRCPQKKFSCRLCKFQGKKDDFLSHIIYTHSNELLYPVAQQNMNASIVYEGNANRNPIEITKNSEGNTSRLGQNGKYYCGRPMKVRCKCCDGNCGPGNGCNCAACMELDVKAMQLPRGYLLNRCGRISKMCTDGKVHCYAPIQNVEIRCTPESSNQCRECAILEQQWNGVYQRLTSG
ncbi:unnamed protein product [Blepharisma stoltei]|uniref:RING-type domain-containing protein n=1 Tax=Blepharisma stoltei TaxID=1481888 RepID=A0AAU9K7B5_9CILI|nr:unnamed protein product [Blepharisma stoltei]